MSERISDENGDFKGVIDEVLHSYNVDPAAFEVLAGIHMQNVAIGRNGEPVWNELSKDGYGNVSSWARHYATEPGEGVVSFPYHFHPV
jgi:hypothetical protein